MVIVRGVQITTLISNRWCNVVGLCVLLFLIMQLNSALPLQFSRQNLKEDGHETCAKVGILVSEYMGGYTANESCPTKAQLWILLKNPESRFWCCV